MSHGSPRHSFSPARPINQSYTDRWRPLNYAPHQYDHPYPPNEMNRPPDGISFRPPPWNDTDRILPPLTHSPVDSHRTRLPPLQPPPYDDDRSYHPEEDRSFHPGPAYRDPPIPAFQPNMSSFRDRSVIPGSGNSFRDRTIAPGHLNPGGTPFQENQISSYNTDERSQGNDHWNPGGSQIASLWDLRNQRSEQRIWSNRVPMSQYPPPGRPRPESPQRPLLEPSQAWKRAREERDRQLSIDYRTIIPPDHRNLQSDNFVPSGSGPRLETLAIPMNDVSDFQARRFRQLQPQQQPTTAPPRFDQRSRFPPRVPMPEPPRRPPIEPPRRNATFVSPRRPLYRISARISARPKRSPSPASASSDSSASGQDRSYRRSRSASRSTRSRPSSLERERETRRDIGSLASKPYGRRISSPRRHSPGPPMRRMSPTRTNLNLHNPLPSQSHTLPTSDSARDKTRRDQPASSTYLVSARPSEVSRPHGRNILRQRSSSVSSRGPQSPMGFSAHLSLPKELKAQPRQPPANQKTQLGVSSRSITRTVPLVTPGRLSEATGTDFELPGMVFKTDGTLKPGLAPSSPKSSADTNKVATSSARSDKPKDDKPEDDKVPDHKPFTEDVHSLSTAITELAREIPPGTSDSPMESGADQKPIGAEISEQHPVRETIGDPRPLPTEPSKSVIVPIVQKKTVNLIVLPPSQKTLAKEVNLVKAKENSPTKEPLKATPVLIPDVAETQPESSPLTEPIALSPPEMPELLGGDGENEVSSLEVDEESPSEAANDVAEALRIFVKAREGKDLQTRNERYEPILRTNHTLLDTPSTRKSASSEEVVREVMEGSFQARLAAHSDVTRSLVEHFTQRTEHIVAKTERLRAEYKAYHERWVANCRKLDKNMASSASQGMEGLPPPSARVTRRSTNFGDAVRSDLEMEQIIASLGNEDMTDPNVLAIRNTAIIPDLVSTDPSHIDISLKDDNGMVDNPGDMYDIYDALGRWTPEEKEVYLQKYGLYPKQFGRIASFLPGKTAAQCIMFYYLHKKEVINFRAAIAKYGPKRKRRGGRKGKGRGNALLADIMKPARTHADEDGLLLKHNGRFSAMHDVDIRQIPSRRQQALLMQQSEAGPSSQPVPEPLMIRGGRLTSLQLQEETGGSDVDSGRSGKQKQTSRGSGRGARLSLSDDNEETGTVVVASKRQSRAVEPPITVREQVVPQETTIKTKVPDKVKEKPKRPPGRPPKKSKDRVTKAISQEEGSPRVLKTATSYVWSKTEETAYVELLKRHGKDYTKIAAEMPAKTALQCRNYFKNHAKDRDLERIAKEAEKAASIDASMFVSGSKATGSIGGRGYEALNDDDNIVKQFGSVIGIISRPSVVAGPKGSNLPQGSMAMPPDLYTLNTSEPTREVHRRLPNFTKSKRRNTQAKD